MIYPTLAKTKTAESARHKMPFREKLKKTFSRHSTSSENSENSSTTSKTRSRKNSTYYQPGETIPYKYRRPVAKEHKEKLEAFSFANAWRRRSHQSLYSPMGSRMPSRQGSIASAVRRSIGSRRGDSTVGPMGESSSVSDAPLSRQHSAEGRSESHKENADPSIQPKGKDFAFANGSVRPNDRTFTSQDLTLALKRSHLQVPTA